MHRLDGHINNIEPRIKAIYENAAKQEETTLQESLSAYGWILLDSWVAWRTLRFLLKELYIDDSVSNKWFQTPSSYTASQLRAAWKFTDNTIDYIEEKTGKKYKNLIDNTIQEKRNSSAHFTNRMEILGADVNEIKMIYSVLSKVFLFYEIGEFIHNVSDILRNEGYVNFLLTFDDEYYLDVSSILNAIGQYNENLPFWLVFENDSNEKCGIKFSKEGCFAEKRFPDGVKSLSIVNEQVKKYNFFESKGYYQNIELFIETVCGCLDSL